MRLVLKWHTCRSEIGAFVAAGRAITGFIRESGLVLTWPRRSGEKVQAWQNGAGVAGRILRAMGVLAGITLLAGCAGQAEPEIRYVRVEVPVQVPCRVPVVAAPTWAAAGLLKTDSLEVKVRALLSERRQRIGYEKLLEAAINTCL